MKAERFQKITFRGYFDRVYQNILKLIEEGFQVKINAVLMRGINDDELLDFVAFTKSHPVVFRFIEFMPFDGNQWKREKTISYQEIMDQIQNTYSQKQIIRLQDAPNDTSKNYCIHGHQGSFAIISTVTHPFCDQCNRIRLTANGQLKNCLFSQKENDLLTALRNQQDIEPIIRQSISSKFAIRSGMNAPDQFEDPEQHRQNRSMITIWG